MRADARHALDHKLSILARVGPGPDLVAELLLPRAYLAVLPGHRLGAGQRPRAVLGDHHPEVRRQGEVRHAAIGPVAHHRDVAGDPILDEAVPYLGRRAPHQLRRIVGVVCGACLAVGGLAATAEAPLEGILGHDIDPLAVSAVVAPALEPARRGRLPREVGLDVLVELFAEAGVGPAVLRGRKLLHVKAHRAVLLHCEVFRMALAEALDKVEVARTVAAGNGSGGKAQAHPMRCLGVSAPACIDMPPAVAAEIRLSKEKIRRHLADAIRNHYFALFRNNRSKFVVGEVDPHSRISLKEVVYAVQGGAVVAEHHRVRLATGNDLGKPELGVVAPGNIHAVAVRLDDERVGRLPLEVYARRLGKGPLSKNDRHPPCRRRLRNRHLPAERPRKESG